MPYGSICCTYNQLKYLSPNGSNKQKDKSHIKEPTFWKKGGLGKKSHENGPKVEHDQTERATGLGRRTRGDTEKWNQTGSLEIPDRGETSETPRPPFRVNNSVCDLIFCS